jgi:beta-lactamase superfamily II metal-dependent hydrolase
LHVLPAGIGDALVIDYGTGDQLRRVVVDGGVTKTSGNLATMLSSTPDLEMVMVSHIDNDHIAGLLKVLEGQADSLKINDIWFNGYRHLPQSPLESMGPIEGERLTTFILDHGIPWNANPPFNGGPITVGQNAQPAVATLPGGLSCTVLSPHEAELAALRPKWQPVVKEANLDPADITPDAPLRPPGRLERLGGLDVAVLAAESTPHDHAEANGTSIAVIMSWAGKTALLSGDAHADVLLETLDGWLGPDGRLEVDLFKLPHHGSKANVTNELMTRVQAKVYVFSSSGEGRSQHPNDQAVARVIVNSTGSRTLAFNYRNQRTEPWDAPALKDARGYTTAYPDAGAEGVTIDLMKL